MHVSLSALRYVHPAFRRFLVRRKFGRRLWKKRISLAARIRNRWLRNSVLPRVAPFHCSKCGFASANLKKMEDHACLKRNSSVNDLERDMKVAQMGFRSKCKDAMAVLERIPNPQSVRLPKFGILNGELLAKRRRIAPLSTLAYNSLKKFDMTLPCSSNLLYEEVPQAPAMYLSTDQSGNNARVALHCVSCEKLFHSNQSYDKHLETNSCSPGPEGPILIQVDADSTVPVEYKLGRRVSKCFIRNRLDLQCTACHVKSNKFETVGKFHRHIMYCRELYRDNNNVFKGEMKYFPSES